MLRVGTKSVLWGAHQFLLHPLFVAWAWWRLYGVPWDPRLWVAFVVHGGVRMAMRALLITLLSPFVARAVPLRAAGAAPPPAPVVDEGVHFIIDVPLGTVRRVVVARSSGQGCTELLTGCLRYYVSQFGRPHFGLRFFTQRAMLAPHVCLPQLLACYVRCALTLARGAQFGAHIGCPDALPCGLPDALPRCRRQTRAAVPAVSCVHQVKAIGAQFRNPVGLA